MYRRSPMTSGRRRARAASALLALLALGALSGCIYGFTGGGLPGHVRTVYVDFFENNTPDEPLRSDVQRTLQQELPRSLGVRLASQQNADAIVRGRLTGYDESTLNVSPTQQPGGRLQPLTRRLVITFEAEIYDVKEDKVLWKQSGINAQGEYNPQREQVLAARDRAITDLVQKIVQGAQSQW